jgi:hypothetical protein
MLNAVTLKDSPASPAVFLTMTMPAEKLTEAMRARIMPVSMLFKGYGRGNGQ